MYGVQAFTRNGSYEPKRWMQVLPPKKTYGARHGQSAYTRYKSVAERWVKEYQSA